MISLFEAFILFAVFGVGIYAGFVIGQQVQRRKRHL